MSDDMQAQCDRMRDDLEKLRGEFSKLRSEFSGLSADYNAHNRNDERFRNVEWPKLTSDMESLKDRMNAVFIDLSKEIQENIVKQNEGLAKIRASQAKWSGGMAVLLVLIPVALKFF